MSTHSDVSQGIDLTDKSRLERIDERLAENADLFDDPKAYLAGVEDTLSKLVSKTACDRPSLEVAWLAAYAIGLAYGQTDPQDATTSILAIAAGDPDLLASARRAIDQVELNDPDTTARTRRLLDNALEQV